MILGGRKRQVVGRGSTQQKHKFACKLENRDEHEAYRDPISFYDQIPDCTVSLDDFEKYALTRLKLLRLIERVNSFDVVKYSIEWEKAVENELRKSKSDFTEFRTVLRPSDNMDSEEVIMGCRKFDHLSHFLLRLAYSRTEELRKWFISLEVDFFRLKLATIKHLRQDFYNLLKKLNFPGELLTGEDRTQKIVADIANCSSSSSPSLNSLVGMDIYKVRFIYALDLVKQRKVFLRDGYAYIPYTDLIGVICSAYRSYLSESLSLVKKHSYLIEQDYRISQIIEDFDKRHTGSDYANRNVNDDIVTAEQLPLLSQKSFPLCMKSLYDVVVKEHHLKHWGRLQLGLFLKAIGVPLDDATKFWRGHFTKKPEIDGNRFDKQYLYNIRHMYGQEGKRADYTPYSCIKVITSNVGPGDHHGCPFKHSDSAPLRVRLVDAKIPDKGVKEILDLVEKQHYQIACQRYFEYTHDDNTVEGGLNHPNQYFEESRDILSGKKTLKAKEQQKKTKVNVYADGSSRSQGGQMSQLKRESEPTPEAEQKCEDMEIDDSEMEALFEANNY